MTSVQYPSANTSTQQAGPNLGLAYDTMGRLNTMTDLAAQASIIGGATYNPANQLLTMSGLVNETRTYNSMLQLTGLTAPNVNISYYYYNSVQNNNGKVTAQVDGISGEQVNYAYDALNRLASAATSYQANVPQWGQSYTYDGFGNLTAQTVTQGSAPAFSAVYDPSTNHPAAGFGSVDANGNLLLYADGGIVAYDGRNRMTGVNSNYQYSYDPSNKRVWRGVWTNGTLTTDEVMFWSVNGQKLATYQMNVTQNVNPPVMYASQTGTNYYFGAKLIKNAGGYVGADRLGSIGHFYPWGQEKPSATQNGTEKFTGYFRDAETGLDYAVNRYHNPGTGRFMTPDPYKANSGGPGDATNPLSWNKYSYALGDPIQFKDPRGSFSCDGDYGDGDDYMASEDCTGTEDDDVNSETCGTGQYYVEAIDTCVDNNSDDNNNSPDCAETIPYQELQYTYAVVYVLDENSFNDRNTNPSIMKNLYTEDLLLASVLNNRAHNKGFAAGGTTMNSQAMAAGGTYQGFAQFYNGINAFIQGEISAPGSTQCVNLVDGFQAVTSVAQNGSTNTQVYYNWGTDLGQPPSRYFRGKFFVTQVNNTMFFGIQ